MMRSSVLTAVLLTATGAHGVGVVAPADSEIARMLRGRMEALAAGLDVRAGDEGLRAISALPAFYAARGFEPAWLGDDGRARVDELLRAIARAEEHGLEPAHYHAEPLRRLTRSVRGGHAEVIDSVELEMLASDAFLTLGSHLLVGRIDPETINPEWIANRRSAEMHVVLEAALQRDAVTETLFGLAPGQPRYSAMLGALRRVRRVSAAGGYTVVPPGQSLKVGESSERVRVLRARLGEEGLVSIGEAAATFDSELELAVREFQRRHGLDVDGAVGPATLAALNVPAEARALQLEANLERFRWLPADLGRKHIEVNIAGYGVTVVEDGRVVRRHRAVVGRLYRQTPMFSGSMTYLVLSPYWHVPPTIASVDKFPVFQANPAAIGEQGMVLLDQRTSEPVDPDRVDWVGLTGAEFNRRYRLRQDPGPTNALGSVKFMFPNRHNVYLHDTPSRDLFTRSSRAFSSGCIRVEDALGLAEYLLADEPGWDRARIDAAVAGGVERTVRLRESVPVHLLYWTAWADEDGVIHYRDDVYGRDTTVIDALAQGPPRQ